MNVKTGEGGDGDTPWKEMRMGAIGDEEEHDIEALPPDDIPPPEPDEAPVEAPAETPELVPA